MDYGILFPVVEELSSLLTGARVVRVIQGGDRALRFLFRNGRMNYTLLISPNRTLPRIHLVSTKPRSVSDPHPLVLNLRSRIVGARVAGIGLLNRDRIVELRFTRDAEEYRLIFEMIGSSTNLFFTRADSHILSLYYPVPLLENAMRTLMPGAQYILPQQKNSRPANRSDRSLDAAFSPNKSAEEYYGRMQEARQEAALRSTLRSYARKAFARVDRLRAALAADLESFEDADAYRTKGDLILANLKQLKTGAESADLAGYDGTRIRVPLDPKRSPSGNAELYFKRYKKARTGMPIILSRLREVEKDVSLLRAMLEDIDQAVDMNSLLVIQAGFHDRYQVKQGARAKPRVAAEEPLGIRKIVFRGWEILVGRSAAGNDLLTTKLARPDDLWLHAEGLPGSHVLIRNPAKAEVPPDILLKAAALAARYSKGRSAGKISVTYTHARFVRKPRGAKTGLVTLSQRRTIMVKPDDDPLRQ